MTEILSVRNLSGGYENRDIIKDVTFGVKKGEFLGIIGPNGSGKSTMMRLMTKALPLKTGSVLFNGKNIQHISHKELSKSVAFISQDPFIHFPFTVWEIVSLGRIPHLRRLQQEGMRDHEIIEQSLKITDTINLKDHQIDELSAGERQRVIIAKGLAQEPELLFLDEPTSHLDISHQIKILNLLKMLNKNNNMTVAIVLHDLNLASEYCSRIMMVDKGKIFCDGSPEQVLTYKNIEMVYKTVVVVSKNPISKKPYVLAVSGEYSC